MEEKYEASTEQAKQQKPKQPAIEEEQVLPGVPIVRTSTPRPLPFSLVSAKTELPLSPSQTAPEFPLEAPEAPPLPEDQESELVDEAAVTWQASRTTQMPPAQAPVPETEQEAASHAHLGEFIWLFEYALDMDPVYLNRPERLNGSAFAYGPAVLKGYRLAFEGLDARAGRVLASPVPLPEQPDEELWGMLYRVPRQLAVSSGTERSLLDKIHGPTMFAPAEIQVYESYRQRQITCITYLATELAHQQISQLSPEQRQPDVAYVKRLLQIARKQKLPTSYLHTLEKEMQPMLAPLSTLPVTPTEPPLEHETEPLAAVKPPEQRAASPSRDMERASRARLVVLVPERWLLIFAVYVSICLLSTLILVLLQGWGSADVSLAVTRPVAGLPWYIFVYGLLGGCISCVISLLQYPQRHRQAGEQQYPPYPPSFVILIWFMRPFLGAFLGALAYLVLTSGGILLPAEPTQHMALCALLSALAGLCEGKLVYRRLNG